MTETQKSSDSEATMNKPNPAALTQMVITAQLIKHNNPEAQDEEIAYLTVKQYLKSPVIGLPNDQLAETCFPYYLEVYRGMKVTADLDREIVIDRQDPRYMLLYNEAALSLFDLYKFYPQDVIVRRMLAMAGHAIHEVVAAQQANSDQPMKELLSYVANVALLAGTIAAYVKGKRRPQNYAYIDWLKSFLAKALSQHDLSFMNDDQVFKRVIKQVTNKAPVIVLE